MKRLWALGIFFVLIVGVSAWWWSHGGQHWAAIQTGTCPQVGPCWTGPGARYGFWSGFGSVIPWALFSMGGILTGLWVGVRKVNCHEKGCYRIGKYPIAGGSFHYCGKHHPDWEGKHPSREHILKQHERHKAAVAQQAAGPVSAQAIAPKAAARR